MTKTKRTNNCLKVYSHVYGNRTSSEVQKTCGDKNCGVYIYTHLFAFPSVDDHVRD